MSSCKARLQAACEVACRNLAGAKTQMKARYDQKAVPRVFDPGDLVLLLVAGAREQLGPGFTGPYRVLRRVGNLNYVISTPDRRTKTRLCHVNALKAYEGRESEAVVCCAVRVVPEEGEGSELGHSPPDIVSARLHNTQALAALDGQLSHLSESQRQDVHHLVDSYPKLFQDVPGRTTKALHDVDTGAAEPVKQHPYRYPPHKKLTIQEEVDYMLQIGVIERADSPWSSPVVLAAQEGRADRLCVDYRKVNGVTKGDAFPIPRLEDCIDQVGHAKYVTKVDLLKGYFQVPLTERASEISAFVTHDGLYRFKVLPFGMKNAPATFQRLMNAVTQGLGNTVTYLDDVVTYSDTWDEHVVHIRALLERLAEAGLVVNLSKCEFGKGRVTYLGHQVGCGAVLPRAAKVQAIVNFPTPRTRTQLMRVLGMCGFYRRFVPNFAAVTAPLTNLLRKEVKWAWTDECQEALAQVKNILSSAPVLKAPDFKQPFALAVDACDVGVGAVLLQAGADGCDRPVAYFSKKLNRHQRAYSTIEKEALALVLAVRHFEVYVASGDQAMKVYSDHNPLAFLAKFRSANARVFRWSLLLQPYSLVIKHIAGKENVIADALSRG